MSNPDPFLEVRSAGAKGRGVFACDFIRSGRKLLEFQGQLLPAAQLTDDMLAMQVGPDLWLASDGSLLDDCVNHSCNPNAGFVTGSVELFALRDIEAGEEITWDYSTSIAEAGWSLDCMCGAGNCRGTVRSWGELAESERERLRGQALAFLR